MVWVSLGFRVMVSGIIGVRVLQLGVSVSVSVRVSIMVRVLGKLGVNIRVRETVCLALGHVP